MISNEKSEEKKEKTDDINVKHFDYVMSKVEIYKFMKRFVGDTSHIPVVNTDKKAQFQVEKEPPSTCWDPN